MPGAQIDQIVRSVFACEAIGGTIDWNMPYTKLKPQSTSDAQVEQISDGSSHYLLSIPSGKADNYRLAQLDDYAQLPRERFPHRSPFTLSLSARTSSNSIPGTWGFGLWNDPFGMSLGFGGKPFRLPALPNTVWFFGASEENYLSFKSPGAERSAHRLQQVSQQSLNLPLRTGESFVKPSAVREAPAKGFLAQSFRAPKFHPLLILAGLALPFSRVMTRRLMGRVIDENAIQLWNQGARSRNITSKLVESKGINPTDWHRYRFEWREKRVSFEVDDAKVFETAVSPNPPLGLVIWIDNQYAAFTPEGKIGFGVLENPETAWLEVKDIAVENETTL